eukprot:CAMPEP_0115849416 /NCGR_PEP_ID=MMETSP0287-20121206/11439_1 /TAXON_ID=412157 /ORGANISM="Chrysochromulina rotalis, Strain UIO044" /LENGTH=415 /DNA_ID=CAMNT_0003303385 /DNA_START=145 /DNA_END=1392 /DNA_ORIENTATION=+
MSRSMCRWNKVDVKLHELGYTRLTNAEWENETQQNFLSGVHDANGSMELQRCKIYSDAGDIFVVDRVGPFNSFGGHDWHRFRWIDVGNLSHLLAPMAVLSSAVLPTTREGVIIPVPPIHAHHWHLNTPVIPYPLRSNPLRNIEEFKDLMTKSRLIAQTHGDSQCPPPAGVECYFQAFPSGQGYPLSDNMISIFGETNDLRAGSQSRLEHWIEVVVTLTTRFVVPCFISGFGNLPWVYDRDFTFFKTFTHLVPSSGQSIHWKQVTFSRCMFATSPWWHTHHHMTADMWLLRGKAEQFRLPKLPSVGEALYLESNTIAMIRSNLTARFQREAYSCDLICTLAPAGQRFEAVPTDINRGIVGGWYERNVMTCPDLLIKAGDTYTLLAFYEATFADPPSQKKFMQHDNLGFVATLCDGE